METIKATDKLEIELGDGFWKLRSAWLGDQPLLTAVEGAGGIGYLPLFAQARQLPQGGSLEVRSVQEVVVGWSPTDRAWHLGLLLGPEIARHRGGRWCELASWPDEYALRLADQVERTGAKLAEVIKRPFRFVEAPHLAPATGPLNPDALQAYVPPPISEAVSAVAGEPERPPELPEVSPAAPPAQVSTGSVDVMDWMKPAVLPPSAGEGLDSSGRSAGSTTGAAEASESNGAAGAAIAVTGASPAEASPVIRVGRQPKQGITLPIDLDGWTLRPINAGLQWAHTGVWSLSTVWQVFFRLAVGIVFIVVSVLTLQSPYAPVQPIGLPYLGIVIGTGLIYAGLRLALSLMRTEAVVVDTEKEQVRRHLDLTSDVVEVYSFDEIEAVVVTQIKQQKHRGHDGKPDTMSHEAWLHLLLREARQERGKHRRLKPEDAYVTIGHIESTEGEIVEAHFSRKQPASPQPLYLEEATTPAQKAALAIAQAIGVDAYVDQR